MWFFYQLHVRVAQMRLHLLRPLKFYRLTLIKFQLVKLFNDTMKSKFCHSIENDL